MQKPYQKVVTDFNPYCLRVIILAITQRFFKNCDSLSINPAISSEIHWGRKDFSRNFSRYCGPLFRELEKKRFLNFFALLKFFAMARSSARHY